MAHKTLVGGTAYNIKGGKCLVDGTGYSIKKGRTLIDGTGYDVNFVIGLTSMSLIYASTVKKGSTINPTITYSPSNANAFKNKTFTITAGSSYATINNSTGALTGVAAGTVTVQVTIVDATGKTFISSQNITVEIAQYTVQIQWSILTGGSYSYVRINGTDYTDPVTVKVEENTNIYIKTEDRETSKYYYYSNADIYSTSNTELLHVSYGSSANYTVTQNIRIVVNRDRDTL